MSIPNRESWYFKATPREMQFLVAGIALGATVLLILQTAGGKNEIITFIGGLALGAAFLVLGIARNS